ncbi:MAG: hypothetical protein PF572_06875 [Patescibacteria group bacterium]|jgi:hypothetical protein|nr:hypothetical protein [Patescibacteria group bacterium]
MRTILLWLTALLITGFFISPFFLFWFLKKKSRKVYVFVSAIISLVIYLWYFFTGYNLIEHFFAKINTDSYYFLYDAGDDALFFIFPILIISFPFIFAKIVYSKFTKKRFFVSLLLSVLVIITLTLILAYYILPGAGSTLLNNI